MPLVLLGLILILGIIIYSIIRYMNGEDGDTRSVRERYPHAFPPRGSRGDASSGSGSIIRSMRPHGNTPDAEGGDTESSIKHTDDGNIIFPTDNVENEKHKRNIH